MVKKTSSQQTVQFMRERPLNLRATLALQYGAALYLLHVVSETKIPSEVLKYIRIDGAPNSG